MTNKQEQVAWLKDRLTHRPLTANDKNMLSLYERWCEANDQPLLAPEKPTATDPSAEQMALRFLHVHRDRWTVQTGEEYLRMMRQFYARNGRPEPRGPRLDAYRKARRREQGGDRGQRPTDALTKAQVNAAAEPDNQQMRESAQVRRLRAVVAVAVVLNIDPTTSTRTQPSVQRLTRDGFRIRDHDIVITYAGERHLLDQETRPDFYRALSDALEDAGDAELPLWDNETTHKRPQVADTELLQAAGRRAFPTSLHPRNRAGWTALFAEFSSDEDWRWWMLNLDGELERRRRDLAYLLGGVATGHRHAELERLTIGHIKVLNGGAGYSHELGPHEHKGGILSARQGGNPKPIKRHLLHLSDDPAAPCPAICAACALRDYLEVRERAGATETSPLFVSSKRRDLPLSRQAAGQRLVKLLDDISEMAPPSEGQKVGTRSMRVTAATRARSDGQSLQEIAAHYTDHQNLRHLERYIRRVDPFSDNLELEV